MRGLLFSRYGFVPSRFVLRVAGVYVFVGMGDFGARDYYPIARLLYYRIVKRYYVINSTYGSPYFYAYLGV